MSSIRKLSVESQGGPVLLSNLDDFVFAHALVSAACRLLEECVDENDRDAAVVVLRQGVNAMNEMSAELALAATRQRQLDEAGDAS